MKKLLIATTNPGKLAEIKRFLSDLPIELVGLADVGIHESPEETGRTFEENAILKATYYAKRSGLPSLADDGGAEIDALGGQPGVKTRRWIHTDRDSTDEELIEYTLKKLEGVPKEKRGMQLRLVLALATPEGETQTVEAEARGIVAQERTPGTYPGFPFRSLMYIPELGKFYNHDQMTQEENEKYNHRKHALEKMKPYIRKLT